jgi:hypothetical protein
MSRLQKLLYIIFSLSFSALYIHNFDVVSSYFTPDDTIISKISSVLFSQTLRLRIATPEEVVLLLAVSLQNNIKCYKSFVGLSLLLSFSDSGVITVQPLIS